jgi:hypothetical protein
MGDNRANMTRKAFAALVLVLALGTRVAAELLAPLVPFTRLLAEAKREINAAKTTNEDVDATLVQALEPRATAQTAYVSAPDQVKRQINQGFFEKLFIGEDGEVVRTELTEPFKALLNAGQSIQTGSAEDPARASQDAPDTPETDAHATRPHSPV